MRTLAAIVTVAALVVLGGSVLAQDKREPGTFTVYGEGTKSCGQWVEQLSPKDNRSSFANSAWVLGYVSGVGSIGVFDLNGTDAAAMDLWISNWCQAHPLESMADAASALVRELRVK